MRKLVIVLFAVVMQVRLFAQEYYPEGTKWTEIRLDTLKYDSWYSKIGDEWVPNFETIEYYVKGEYEDKYRESPYKYVHTNGPEWTDSLTLLIYEGKVDGYDMGVLVTIPVFYENELFLPNTGTAYQFNWNIGQMLKFRDIISSNTTEIYSPGTFDFGKIEEIKEGEFGGVRTLKYTDVNDVRIIQGIGVTEWNDGECIFGPVEPYRALAAFKEGFPYEERHYRSMLVHFERNDEVLYDLWPEKGTNGIKIVNNSEKKININYYDLQGRKLQQTPQKGIFIQNSRKVAVK